MLDAVLAGCLIILILGGTVAYVGSTRCNRCNTQLGWFAVGMAINRAKPRDACRYCGLDVDTPF